MEILDILLKIGNAFHLWAADGIILKKLKKKIIFEKCLLGFIDQSEAGNGDCCAGR